MVKCEMQRKAAIPPTSHAVKLLERQILPEASPMEASPSTRFGQHKPRHQKIDRVPKSRLASETALWCS